VGLQSFISEFGNHEFYLGMTLRERIDVELAERVEP